MEVVFFNTMTSVTGGLEPWTFIGDIHSLLWLVLSSRDAGFEYETVVLLRKPTYAIIRILVDIVAVVTMVTKKILILIQAAMIFLKDGRKERTGWPLNDMENQYKFMFKHMELWSVAFQELFLDANIVFILLPMLPFVPPFIQGFSDEFLCCPKTPALGGSRNGGYILAVFVTCGAATTIKDDYRCYRLEPKATYPFVNFCIFQAFERYFLSSSRKSIMGQVMMKGSDARYQLQSIAIEEAKNYQWKGKVMLDINNITAKHKVVYFSFCYDHVQHAQQYPINHAKMTETHQMVVLMVLLTAANRYRIIIIIITLTVINDIPIGQELFCNIPNAIPRTKDYYN